MEIQEENNTVSKFKNSLDTCNRRLRHIRKQVIENIQLKHWDNRKWKKTKEDLQICDTHEKIWHTFNWITRRRVWTEVVLKIYCIEFFKTAEIDQPRDLGSFVYPKQNSYKGNHT